MNQRPHQVRVTPFSPTHCMDCGKDMNDPIHDDKVIALWEKEGIDTTDIPELTPEQLAKARRRNA